MAVELGSARLGDVFRRMLPPSLFFERPREKRGAREEEKVTTYLGNVCLSSDRWSLKVAAPVFPSNPVNVDEYHFLDSDDYRGADLIISDPNNRERVLLRWKVDFYSDGVREPAPKGETPRDYNFTHPRGVNEAYLLDLCDRGCPAELKTPVSSARVATAGETAGYGNTIFGGTQVRKLYLGLKGRSV